MNVRFIQKARQKILRDLISPVVSPLNRASQPNINGITAMINRIDALSLSVKFFGYELARTLAAALPPCADVPPQPVDLACKPSTQADIGSDWLAHWCSQLQIPRIYHRKIWELAYVLQAIYRHGSIRPGARGLGFGCGQEPIPSYLASRGVSVTVTDQPIESMINQGWAKSGQYTETLDISYRDHLVDRATFDRLVTLRHVDMNDIDPDLVGYDFCWSVCACEHLGSIDLGMAFIENSLKTLRPGGLSVHTTEFNFANDHATIDNWPTVLFQRRHFEQLAASLSARGHSVAPLDFDVGRLPLDKFIDVPPYNTDWSDALKSAWEGDGPAHIKLSIDGFPATCFGIIVRKSS